MPYPYLDVIANAYKSERLVYRAMEDSDEDKAWLSEFLQNDPTNTMMASNRLPVPQPLGSVKEFLDHSTKCLLCLFFCLAPEGQEAAGEGASDENNADKDTKSKKRKPSPIGMIILFPTMGSPAISHHRSAMIGISTGAPYRGKGYGGEAINWALDWGFRHAGLHRVSIMTWSYNHPAVGLYRKLGFVDEGRQREAIFLDRKWHDIIMLGMLEHEWEKLRGIESSQ